MDKDQHERLLNRLLDRLARELEEKTRALLPPAELRRLSALQLKMRLDIIMRALLRVHVGDDIEPSLYSVVIQERYPIKLRIIRASAIDLLGDVHRMGQMEGEIA